MHWVPTGQTVTKEYYIEVLREFRKRFRRKRPALFKSGQWHFQQDNAAVYNSILVTDNLTKMGIRQFLTLPIVHTFLPVTFGYSLSSRRKIEAVVYKTIEDMKEAVTKDIGTLSIYILCICVYIYIYIYIYDVYVCVYVNIDIYIYIYIYMMYRCVYVYIDIYMNIYIIYIYI